MLLCLEVGDFNAPNNTVFVDFIYDCSVGSCGVITGRLRDHLMEELDYFLLPEAAWNKLTLWYGLSQGSSVIARKVVEHGMYIKHCKVETYLLEFKLTIHPNIDDFKPCSFSRDDTVADLEAVIREEFDIEKDAECRIWHRFMTHYELLSNPSQTLQDAGLYNTQVNTKLTLESIQREEYYPYLLPRDR